MPSLDVRGQIAAAQIAFYVPITACTLALIYRYAFRHDAGWLFLCIFSLIRITGGALLVAAELVVPSKIDLFIAAYVLQPAGLPVLMLATIGFLGLAGQSTYSENPRVSMIFRMFGFLALIALALTIPGGIVGTHVKPGQGHVGLTLRRVSAGIFAGLYVLLFLAHLGCWTYRYQMRTYRFKLLVGLTLALPFLGVRIAYAILAAWSSSDVFGLQPSPNPVLAKFNPATTWVPFLIMSLIMEYVVTVLYLLFSTVLARRHR
ncbi:hypothetical protein L208DRAFT_1446915 [Tricholoma matsutake]|nr:hypothetical protein L208DRAFT_1446915 [Tricholoma matsutake 945]